MQQGRAEAILDWVKLEQIMAEIYASKTGRPSY
jgi:IS5 family transposase